MIVMKDRQADNSGDRYNMDQVTMVVTHTHALKHTHNTCVNINSGYR